MKTGWPDVPQLHHLQSEFCAHYWSGKGCKSHWSIIGVGNAGRGCPGYTIHGHPLLDIQEVETLKWSIA